MPDARLRDALPRARDAAWLCAARGLASFSAYHSGFRALSDDDYARISIAQRFAESPSFDPSHTSWLPAPFWLYGVLFRCFGSELAVARVTAIALGVAATLLVYVAARLLGVGRPGALAGAILSTVLPYSALLGIAAVPEVPCAALIVLGAATLARDDPKLRALGGVLLCLACLSRYEAWPVAAVFAGFSLCDARAKPKFVAGAALALLGPAVWLLVGRAEHGQAVFFVSRVASYRRALGPAIAGSFAQRLLEYPELLLRAAPELCGLFLVVAVVAWRGAERGKLLPYRRAGLGLLALLAFLIFGSVRDGVPTHHAARVLLPIWFFVCVLCGDGLAHLVLRTSGRMRASLARSGRGRRASSACSLDRTYCRLKALPSASSSSRSAVKPSRRGLTSLAIDTPDYGYLAVQAAFPAPRPSHTSPLDDHDPRHVRPPDPFRSDPSLGNQVLRERGTEFLVATREHAGLARRGAARSFGRTRASPCCRVALPGRCAGSGEALKS